MRPHRLALAACALLVSALACRGEAGSPAPAAQAPARPDPARTQAAPSAQPDPTRLPEDPVAAKQAEEQWRRHLEHEEEERQMWFDRARIAQHRALAKLLTDLRARYDHASSEAALAKVRADMPKRLAEVQRRVTEIDHWGNNSRLLPNYAALAAALAGPYADAKLAALKGDPQPLALARGSFDTHLETMAEWLERTAEVEHEGEAEGEHEGEHEGEREAEGDSELEMHEHAREKRAAEHEHEAHE
jgi:hypothetical protein